MKPFAPPPPPGAQPPPLWGSEAHLHELFGDRVDFHTLERDVLEITAFERPARIRRALQRLLRPDDRGARQRRAQRPRGRVRRGAGRVLRGVEPRHARAGALREGVPPRRRHAPVTQSTGRRAAPVGGSRLAGAISGRRTLVQPRPSQRQRHLFFAVTTSSPPVARRWGERWHPPTGSRQQPLRRHPLTASARTSTSSSSTRPSSSSPTPSRTSSAPDCTTAARRSSSRPPAHRHAFEQALRHSGDRRRARDRRPIATSPSTPPSCSSASWSTACPMRGSSGRSSARCSSAPARGSRRVRVYGEMVALLWAAGDTDAAIALEGLWNELAETHEFALLCAYPMSAFKNAAGAAAFEQVCGTHTHRDPQRELLAAGGRRRQAPRGRAAAAGERRAARRGAARARRAGEPAPRAGTSTSCAS